MASPAGRSRKMAFLKGIGVYLPAPRQSAAQIAAASGLPEAVVRDKLGIHHKVVPGPQDHTCAMGISAARRALAAAAIDPNEIDVVISINEEHKEYPLWTSGIKLANEVGAQRAWAYDVGQKCGTGVLSLKLARDLLRADEQVSTVLVAGGYRNSDLIDYRDPDVRFMYNLAAAGGAAVLSRNGPGHEVLGSSFITDGSFSLDVKIPVGGTVTPLTPGNVADYRMQVSDMAGMRERMADRSTPNFLRVVREAVARSGAQLSDIAYVAMLHMKPSAHQTLLTELGLRPEQSIYLSDYGHCGQLDLFLSLDLAQQQGRIRPGDLVVGVAAGIGYVWNAICLRWGESA